MLMLKKYYLRLTIEVQDSPDNSPEVMDDFLIAAESFHQAGTVWRMLIQLMGMLLRDRD